MFVWQAHKGKVRSLAFSPDGTLLATATGTARLVTLWNPATGQVVRKLDPGADEAAQSVAFAPGAALFAAGMSRSVRVWDTASWQLVAVLNSTERWAGAYFETAIGPGPAPQLAAADSRRAYIWDEVGLAEKSEPRPQARFFGVGNVPCLDFSPDGVSLTVNLLAKAELRNARTGELVRELPHTHSRHHGPVKFSPDGTRLAVGYRNLVAVFPLAGGVPEVTCSGHTDAVWAACWSRDGSALLSASQDGTAVLWNPGTGERLKTFDWGIGEIRSAAFSADGLLGAAASKDGRIVVWDVDG